MSRKRWIILGVVGIVAIGVLLAYYLVFPRLVKIAVKHTLAGAGVEYVSLDVSNASPWRAHLANIVVGRNGVPIEIRNVGLYYTPQELFSGNLHAIVLKGVTISATVKDGKIDLGPITNILQRRAEAATRESKPAPTTAPALPVDHIALRDSTLKIHTPRGTLEWPMNASLLVNRDNQYALNLTLRTLTELAVSGTIDPNTGTIDLTASGQKIRGALVEELLSGLMKSPPDLDGTFDADAHLQLANSVGTLSGTVKPNDLAIANLTLSSGVLKAETTLGGPASTAKLTISDASVQAAGLKGDGVSGNLRFPSLSPLRSDPAQRIDIAQVSIGQVQMKNGSVQFEVKSPQSIHIEQASANVFDGSVSVLPFDFSPGGSVRLTIKGDNIDLKQLLDVFGQGKVTGSGKLSGQVPITIGPKGVQFGQGALFATRDGQIQVKDLSILAQTLAQAAGGKNASSAQQVRQNIIEALSDFQYDRLSADLENDEHGKLMAVVHIGGQGRTGAKQALELNIRIRGIEDLLRVVLNIRSRLNASR